MQIVGITHAPNSKGERTSTIHVLSDFPEHNNAPEQGRFCQGKQASSVYVGTYDVSHLKLGMEIDIFYDKAFETKSGTYSPVKLIQVINK